MIVLERFDQKRPTHAKENQYQTRCGLYIEGLGVLHNELRGDWREVNAQKPTCKNCLRSLKVSLAAVALGSVCVNNDLRKQN